MNRFVALPAVALIAALATGCATYVPPLTSVHQNFIDAGVLLARKVRALIEGGEAASETLPTHLVVRTT